MEDKNFYVLADSTGVTVVDRKLNILNFRPLDDNPVIQGFDTLHAAKVAADRLWAERCSQADMLPMRNSTDLCSTERGRENCD